MLQIASRLPPCIVWCTMLVLAYTITSFKVLEQPDLWVQLTLVSTQYLGQCRTITEMFGTLQLIEQMVGRLSVCEEHLEPSQLAPLVEPLK